MAELAYVADSSVFASIIIKDEFHGRASRFLRRYSGMLATLDLAFVEVANALWRHVYLLKRIPEDSYPTLRDSIRPLIANAVSRICKAGEILEEALDNAVKLGITVYDSLYVTLALSEKCRLASFDVRLKKRLREEGLDIVVIP